MKTNILKTIKTIILTLAMFFIATTSQANAVDTRIRVRETMKLEIMTKKLSFDKDQESYINIVLSIFYKQLEEIEKETDRTVRVNMIRNAVKNNKMLAYAVLDEDQYKKFSKIMSDTAKHYI